MLLSGTMKRFKLCVGAYLSSSKIRDGVPSSPLAMKSFSLGLIKIVCLVGFVTVILTVVDLPGLTVISERSGDILSTSAEPSSACVCAPMKTMSSTAVASATNGSPMLFQFSLTFIVLSFYYLDLEFTGRDQTKVS